MPSEHPPASDVTQLNVDPAQVHLVVTTTELGIIVDALASVGNVELARWLQAILQQVGQRRESDA